MVQKYWLRIILSLLLMAGAYAATRFVIYLPGNPAQFWTNVGTWALITFFGAGLFACFFAIAWQIVGWAINRLSVKRQPWEPESPRFPPSRGTHNE